MQKNLVTSKLFVAEKKALFFQKQNTGKASRKKCGTKNIGGDTKILSDDASSFKRTL